MRGTTLLATQLLYGGGLRLLECLQLRVKDVDFNRRQIYVRDTKNSRDRVTLLPQAVVPLLKEHIEHVLSLHAADLELGFGSVSLPTALSRTFPNADREF